MPLDAKCNPNIVTTQSKHERACEMAKLALAVWKADPAKFAEMDAWLFENQTPDYKEARRHAVALVGADALAEAESGVAVDAAIRQSVRAYGHAGRGAIPKLMLPQVTVPGRVDNVPAFYALLEKELGLKAVE